jgi:hypothetical protein
VGRGGTLPALSRPTSKARHIAFPTVAVVLKSCRGWHGRGIMDKPTTAISEFVNDQGLPEDRTPDVEVALRLTEFILTLPGSRSMTASRSTGPASRLVMLSSSTSAALWLAPDGSRSRSRRLAGTPGPVRTGAGTRPSACIRGRAKVTWSPRSTAAASRRMQEASARLQAWKL